MNNRLYAMDTAPLQCTEGYAALYRLLPAERRCKADRFVFLKDRLLSAAAGVLLEQALTEAGVRDRRISFSPEGKPFLTGGELHFNLSHSEHLAVCAVSDACVGADAEAIRSFDRALAEHVFHPQECRQAAASPDRCFTLLWTVKESIMKYLGTGLTLAPKEITVDLEPPISATCSRFDVTGLHFTVLEAAGCIVTVCSEYAGFADQIQFVTIPFQKEGLL